MSDRGKKLERSRSEKKVDHFRYVVFAQSIEADLILSINNIVHPLFVLIKSTSLANSGAQSDYWRVVFITTSLNSRRLFDFTLMVYSVAHSSQTVSFAWNLFSSLKWVTDWTKKLVTKNRALTNDETNRKKRNGSTRGLVHEIRRIQVHRTYSTIFGATPLFVRLASRSRSCGTF